MQRPDIPRIFNVGGAGLLLAIWWALIWLKPTSPPDYMVKVGFVLIILPTAIFLAYVISQWITYFRERP